MKRTELRALTDDDLQARLTQRGLTMPEAWRLVEQRDNTPGEDQILAVMRRPLVS